MEYETLKESQYTPAIAFGVGRHVPTVYNSVLCRGSSSYLSPAVNWYNDRAGIPDEGKSRGSDKKREGTKKEKREISSVSRLFLRAFP